MLGKGMVSDTCIGHKAGWQKVLTEVQKEPGKTRNPKTGSNPKHTGNTVRQRKA